MNGGEKAYNSLFFCNKGILSQVVIYNGQELMIN